MFFAFTKPFRMDIPQLGERIAKMGFDGVELPVRAGYAVHPANAAAELPRAVAVLKSSFGLVVGSVATDPTPEMIAALGDSGVPILRICPSIENGESYRAAETRHKRAFDTLVPHLEKHRVALGIQNHSGRNVPVHAFGLASLLAPYDPKHVCAVWDAAHNALQGEDIELALDLIHGPRLKMVNLKNAIRKRDGDAWRTQWVPGPDGFSSWPNVLRELKKRGYMGPICLTAEYSEPDGAEKYLASDLAYAKSI